MPVIADRSRRRWLRAGAASLGALALAGCERLSTSGWFPRLLERGESLTRRVQQGLGGRRSMAQEFAPEDRSPEFRSNGTSMPDNPAYEAMVANGFSGYRLQVDGMVAKPMSLTLEELRALPSRTQITRHDCVEGWSAIAKWKGARLSALLDAAGVSPGARYVVFHCADPMEPNQNSPYYESIDMDDAYHVQTLLAYELNDRPLPVPNGAPIRLRVERQLGYKHAKYIMRIEVVSSFASIRGGKGGYWEDNGYEWFAGI
jgi:DMSO/TMAO reductase YedYZ molybdopterin-dependent catalytic subunit